MDIIQAGRIVKRIGDLMRNGGQDAHRSTLAQEYAELCRAAARRLEQCETMLKAGDQYQALQLAESTPNLPELIMLLGFRGCEQWREYCTANHLALAEPFDVDALRRLNAAYGTGIGADHQIFKQYRQALLSEDFENALGCARLIAKLNPNDKSAPIDIQRLESRVLQQRLAKLTEILAGRDPSSVIKLLEDIEALKLGRVPSGEAWVQANLIRLRGRIEALHAARRDGDWVAVAWIADELRGIQSRTAVDLDPDAVVDLEAAETWAESEERAAHRERQFQQLTSALEEELGRADSIALSGQPRSLDELRRAKERLESQWHAWRQAGRQASEDLALRYESVSTLLDATLSRIGKRRQRGLMKFAAAALAAALVLGCASWIWIRGIAEARHLEGRIAKSDFASLQDRLPHSRSLLAARLGLGRLALAVNAAETAVQRNSQGQDELLRACADIDAALSQLPRDEVPWSSIARIQSKVDDAQRLLRDTQGSALNSGTRRFVETTNAWSRRLGEIAEARNATLSKQLQEARDAFELAPELQEMPSRHLAAVREIVGGKLLQIAELAHPALPALEPRPAVRVQFADLASSWQRWNAEASNYLDSTAQLAKATSIESYLERLDPLARNSFARRLRNNFLSKFESNWRSLPANLISALIFPAHPETLDRLRGSGGQTFETAVKLSQEQRRKLATIWSEQRITRVVRCDISDTAQRGRAQRQGFLLTNDESIGPEGRVVSANGKLYDPAKSPHIATFADFSADAKSVLILRNSPERDLRRNTGFADLIDKEIRGLGLFDCLDALNQHDAASPLCRAWIFLQVSQQLLEVSPYDCGLQYVPALPNHRDEILRIVEGRLEPSDWMLRGKQEKYQAALTAHFKRAASISYARQARFFHQIAIESLPLNPVFVGFADPEHALKLRILSPPPRSEIYGWSPTSPAPVRIGELPATNGPAEVVLEPCLFSPLFGIRGEAKTILSMASSKCRIPADDPSIKPYLPPWFALP